MVHRRQVDRQVSGNGKSAKCLNIILYQSTRVLTFVLVFRVRNWMSYLCFVHVFDDVFVLSFILVLVYYSTLQFVLGLLHDAELFSPITMTANADDLEFC